MKKFINRSMAWLLTLVMCLSLLSGIQLPEAEAATTYVANWGVRGEVATSMSSAAVAFYEEAGVTYSGLSGLTGASAVESVPNSALFKQLQLIMKTYHTHETDYDETKNLYQYTDCQEGDTQYITCIWCGVQYDGAWPYGGDPWNREHTWPKSKSLDGNDPDCDQVDEEDIMLLRPACRGENSSHSNKAYGSATTDTYFYPNIDKGYGQDSRGDIARTMLYVYVRYGNSTYMWGESGVIHSKELLLQWMREDPVDTWEMGRNDSVESITGTRNIFVDYPELGFKLFNATIPSGYQTPSGGQDSGIGSTVTVKFSENGAVTGNMSLNAGSAFTFPAANRTAPTGYSFLGWVAGTVNETTVRPENIYAPGDSALASSRTYCALYTRVDATQIGSDYVPHTGAITEGDYMFIAGDGAMSTAANGSAKRRDVIPVTITNNTIYSPDSALIWHIAPTNDGYYTFYNKTAKQYVAANGTANQLIMQSSVDDYAKWSISNGVITNKGNQAKSVNHTLRRNGNYGFACYSTSYGTQPVLYKAAVGAVIYTTTVAGAVCQHTNVYTSGEIAATCTSAGYTAGVYCSDCGSLISGNEQIPALGHRYTSVETKPTTTQQGYTTHTCTRCGHSYVDSYTEALGETFYVSFSVPYGVQAVETMACDKNGITLPTADAPAGYTFLGWSTTAVDDTESKPVPLTGTYTANTDITLYALYSYTEGGTGAAEYVLTDISQIGAEDVFVITMQYNSTIYALDNSAASKNPKAPTVTASNGKLTTKPGDELLWNLGGSQNAWIFYPNGTTARWLAISNTNAGISVGTGSAKTFSVSGNYLYYSGYNRYLGVYRTNLEWRSYNNTTNNIANQTLGFYVKTQPGTTYYTTMTSTEPAVELTHISLDPNNDALGYKADAKNLPEGAKVQISLWVTEDIVVTKDATSLRLKNILANNGGEMTIYAKATIVDAEGEVITESAVAETSMKDTIIAVNAIGNQLNDDQALAVFAYYEQYQAIMDAWLGDNNDIQHWG
ncbi:MAG: endonuclease [Oscillospiraceae bacterium]|nr:endonuclease [Oscillospiraceae bacterium]